MAQRRTGGSNTEMTLSPAPSATCKVLALYVIITFTYRHSPYGS